MAGATGEERRHDKLAAQNKSHGVESNRFKSKYSIYIRISAAVNIIKMVK